MKVVHQRKAGERWKRLSDLTTKREIDHAEIEKDSL